MCRMAHFGYVSRRRRVNLHKFYPTIGIAYSIFDLHAKKSWLNGFFTQFIRHLNNKPRDTRFAVMSLALLILIDLWKREHVMKSHKHWWTAMLVICWMGIHFNLSSALLNHSENSKLTLRCLTIWFNRWGVCDPVGDAWDGLMGKLKLWFMFGEVISRCLTASVSFLQNFT